MKSLSLLVVLIISNAIFVNAQDVTTVEAASADISDNLDLEAVASVFGQAKDIEDFEKMLNDPEKQISNLDLSGDGYVDYLRVVEGSDMETHVIIVQAVIGENLFQDVATIDVEKDDSGDTKVQVVGDVYMYGPDYIITPVYVHQPVIFVWFWGPAYHPWRSPYYWGYYPRYYHSWRVYPVHRYHSHLRVHININHRYHRSSVRYSSTSVKIHNKHRRTDYAKQHPNKAFQARNSGVKNRQELDSKRKQNKNTMPANAKQTGRPVKKDWKPQSDQRGKDNRQNKSTPSTQPATKPSAHPSKPSKKHSGQPSTRPSAKPSKQQSAPAARPSSSTKKTPTQPSTRPAKKTSGKSNR